MDRFCSDFSGSVTDTSSLRCVLILPGFLSSLSVGDFPLRNVYKLVAMYLRFIIVWATLAGSDGELYSPANPSAA